MALFALCLYHPGARERSESEPSAMPFIHHFAWEGIPCQGHGYSPGAGIQGTVENLDDGRVKIIAEGDEDKLKWFEEAICIKNTLIDVSSIEKEYSTPRDDVNRFYKLVDRGETDSRLDTAADHLKNLIVAVNNMNQNIGGKIDQMNDNLSGKMDVR